MQPKIGINFPEHLSFELLHTRLRSYTQDGFSHVEFSFDTFPLIIDGELCLPWIRLLRHELDSHPNLLFSGHIGRGLDLRDKSSYELHRKVLHSSIEACSTIGLNPLVLHYEKKSDDPAVERQFIDAHKEAADIAGDLGLTLCIENIEVERADAVLECVSKIDHPHVQIAFDTGHAALSSAYFGYDMMQSLRDMKPYIGHVHLSDNTARFEPLRITDRTVYDSLPMGYRRTYGRGDIHLPPYFGTIPFDEIFSILADCSCVYICEYTSEEFLPFNEEICTAVRGKILSAREP